MSLLFEHDPDSIGNEEEELELDNRLREALHSFEAGPDGRCVVPTRKFCQEHKVIDYHNPCRAERHSVLHWDEEAEFRERHWHGGGDCMCFEDEG